MENKLTCNHSFWKWEEDKAFETALATYSSDICPWEKIAAAVLGRTVDEIKNHFEVLVSDINAIDSGDVPLPQYTDSFKKTIKCAGHASASRKKNQSAKRQNPSGRRAKSLTSDGKQKKGKLWTEEEDRYFIFQLCIICMHQLIATNHL